ncbi:unnamed protein product [Schistocephalus solidus]|uniref:ANK_REP_REGION domain-containing protein n=1 Tax=Schistocephalus solidus TaxID=70667 RepID=A0A183SQT7_SCHSO|nr:unnamed protein product [Schistocephalus solidus]
MLLGFTNQTSLRYGQATCNGNSERINPPIPSPRLSRPASASAVDETSRQTVRTQPKSHVGVPLQGAPQSQRPPSIASNASSTRIKTPRYASRKFISDTYLTPLRRDTVEKYKRSATEHLQENLASQNAALTRPDSTHSSQVGVEVVLPEAQHLTINSPPLAGNVTRSSAVPYQEEECSSPSSSSSSSSTSSSTSLPFIDSDNTLQEVKPTASQEVSEEAEYGGSEASTIADTGSGQTLTKASDTPAEDEENANSQDGQGAAFAADTCVPKPILRGASGDRDFKAQGPANDAEGRKGVRFHPLALLLDAALEGDLQLVKKAALEVSDVSEPNDEGITALHNAVCAGRADVADFLVREVGADVNAGDTDGWTPLHCAASCGNLQLAKLLVEHGAALHSRTLSDHETALEKCDQGDHDAECERYLAAEEDLLGAANEGRVYGLFPRGLEAAGPGSHDAQIEPDELPIWPNEELRIIDRSPANELEWMLAENAEGHQGLVPRAYISRFPLLRIPPASRPIPARSPSPERSAFSPLTLLGAETPSSGRTTPQMVELTGGSELEFQVESLDESFCDSREEVSVDPIQETENFTDDGTGYAGPLSAHLAKQCAWETIAVDRLVIFINPNYTLRGRPEVCAAAVAGTTKQVV